MIEIYTNRNYILQILGTGKYVGFRVVQTTPVLKVVFKGTRPECVQWLKNHDAFLCDDA